MINASRRRFVAGLAAAPVVLGAQGGKPLTIILTVPPGTSSDTLARMLGEKLKARLNRPVVVDSRSGAGGLVAIQHLKAQDADGSYLMMAPNSAVSLLPLFSTKPTFDLDKDMYPRSTASRWSTKTAPWRRFTARCGRRKSMSSNRCSWPAPARQAGLHIEHQTKSLRAGPAIHGSQV